MSRKAVTRAVREVYALHHMLLNLGFRNEEMFVGVPYVLDADPPGTYALVKLVRGDKSMTVWLEPLAGKDIDRFIKAWSEFSHAQPRMNRAELDRMVETSRVRTRYADILAVLVTKGFEFGSEMADN